MGEKDLSEKILEDYNDVFADIINALIFEGKDVVQMHCKIALFIPSIRLTIKGFMSWREMSQNTGYKVTLNLPYMAWKIRQKLKNLCHFGCLVTMGQPIAVSY